MSKNKVIDSDEYKYFNSPKFKSEELLEEALDATSKNKALKLAKQALEFFPDNIDAENLIAEYEENPIKKLKKYDSIIEKATKLLEEQNEFILDFLLNENGEFLKGQMSNCYSYGSEEEAFLIIHDLMYLLGSVPSFIAFIELEYRKGRN